MVYSWILCTRHEKTETRICTYYVENFWNTLFYHIYIYIHSIYIYVYIYILYYIIIIYIHIYYILYIIYIYIYIYIYISHWIVELITTTFYNLRFNVLQSSGKWCYILRNILLTSKLYFDKITKILLRCWSS